MRRFLQVFYALFSAFILSAAISNEFLPFGSPVLGLLSLVPLYMALSEAGSYRWAGVLAGLQAFFVQVFSSFWLMYFKDFAIFTLGASSVAYFVWMFMFGQFLYAAFSPRAGRTGMLRLYAGTASADIIRRILLFAVLWPVWEWGKSNGFLGYPWGVLVMTAYKWPLVTQIADITGTWGISFLFAFFSALIAEGLLLLAKGRRTGKPAVSSYAWAAAACAAFFGITVLYGAYQLSLERIPEKTLNAVLVQQNIDSWLMGDDTKSIEISERLTEQAIEKSGKEPDLVVWSEATITSAFPYSYPEYEKFPPAKPLLPFIRQTGTPFLIGGPYQENGKYYNSAFLFTPDGAFADWYGKMQLVPFAEIIPGADNPLVQKFMRTLIGFSDGWTPGYKLKIFEVSAQNGKKVRFSTPICYEDAFPLVCRALYKSGSEVFMNITNDSWSKTNSAEYQHFVIASFRATELRTTLVRSTNSGYSAVVGPTGQVLADMPLFREASIFTEIPVYPRVTTIYAVLGDWFIYVGMVISAIAIVYQATKRKD